jgi:hypothetical protein
MLNRFPVRINLHHGFGPTAFRFHGLQRMGA